MSKAKKVNPYQRGLDASEDARRLRELLRRRYHVDSLAGRILNDMKEAMEDILIAHRNGGVDWDYLERYLAAMEILSEVDIAWTLAELESGEHPQEGGYA